MVKEIEKAIYVDDDNSIRILYKDATYETIYCSVMDDLMDTGVIGESRLTWLANHEPEGYARMVLEDKLKDYIDLYVQEYAKQEKRIEKCQTRKGADKIQAKLLAREFMMYDS